MTTNPTTHAAAPVAHAANRQTRSALSAKPFLLAVIAVIAGALALPAQAITIRSVGQAAVELPSAFGARQLSDLAYDGNSFYAVGDQDARLYTLDIPIDPNTGFIGSPTVTASVDLLNTSGQPFAVTPDFEGLTTDGAGGLLLTNERGNSIYRYSVSGGAALEIVAPSSDPQLNRFANARGNLGLESISTVGGVTWVANEEALSSDGPTSADAGADGTLVRLQRLDGSLAGNGQWAYAVDSFSNSAPGTFGNQNSGVSGVLALPNGDLLVLERRAELNFPPFSTRIYRVDFTAADDVSAVAMLDGSVATVGKELLFAGGFFGSNFEGLALGPTLDSGETSLLLVSDDGDGLGQNLFALAIDGLQADPVPTPGSLLLLLPFLAGLRYQRAN